MSERRPTLAHRVEFALFRGAVRFCDLVGDRAADRFGAFLGRLGWWPLGIRRALVLEQLRASFPDRDDRWIARTAAAAYAHLGREALAMLRISTMRPGEVVARTEVEGLDAFRAALAEGRGVVVAAGHLGNWEIGGAALAARGIPLDVVAQRQSNPLFDRMIVQARERLGLGVIERGRATRAGMRALRDGRPVAFVSDQDARDAGVFVPFFGRYASTHRGAAVLALRTGAPLFLGTAIRVDSRRWRVRLQAIEVDRQGETEMAVVRLTAAFTARLETAIRESPEQYFWFHRRWKTRPAQEPAAPGAGINEENGPRPFNVIQRLEKP